MIRRVLAAAAILLAAFHVWLFAGQLWSGELGDFALISRWLIAAGLTAALFNLHRRGLSLVRGRHAVAVWLLAALLHGPALARDIEGVSPSMPEVVSTIVQTVTAVGALGTLLLVLVAFRGARVQAPAWRRLSPSNAPAAFDQLADCFPQFAPRPPPASSITR
jgi:hypothetical protein